MTAGTMARPASLRAVIFDLDGTLVDTADELVVVVQALRAEHGRDPMDPAQNLRGGMVYLRWLLAYFEGDIVLAAAAYNAGEGAVERYRGVPPFAETRLYVRKILAHLGGRRTHPYDVQATPASDVLARMRGPSRWR